MAWAKTAHRAVLFTSGILFCLLMAGVLAIQFWGHAVMPRVTLDLVAPPQRHKPVVIFTPQVIRASGVLVSDPALIEPTAQGPLPKIAADGRKPMAAYAAPAPTDAKFKIALVVSGLGLSATATAQALDILPAGVTLGFVPYADNVGDWVMRARGRGYEVLLEIPMEPPDFPDSDPGPNSLRTDQDTSTNINNLHWALSRFTGYAGVTNLLGQRFLSNETAMSPIISELDRRGLYFFDTEDPSIDAIASAPDIDRRLSDLEAQARTHGSAIGRVFLYPVSLARIAAWAAGLKARGFVLVPLSAIVSGSKPPCARIHVQRSALPAMCRHHAVQ